MLRGSSSNENRADDRTPKSSHMKVAFCSVADLPINWKGGGGGGGGELGISRPVDLCDNNNFRRFLYHVNESETKKLAAIKTIRVLVN